MQHSSASSMQHAAAASSPARPAAPASASASASSATSALFDGAAAPAMAAEPYPFGLADSQSIESALSLEHLHAQQVLNSLLQLSDEARALCLADGDKVVGTAELATRLAELRAMLEEHANMLLEQKDNAMVARAAEGLRKALISTKHVLRAALDTNFRRGARFKNPVRIEINNLVLANSKLGHAIALAYAKSGAGGPERGGRTGAAGAGSIRPGQEECLAGDKAFFGHGVAQDYAAALAFYRQAADLAYAPAINSLATMLREGKGAPRDLPAAIEWYKKAAALNNLDAINKSVDSRAPSDATAEDCAVDAPNSAAI